MNPCPKPVTDKDPKYLALNEIPYGHCRCGCGKKTSIAKRNNKRFGWVKGEPLKFFIGHYLNRSGEDSPGWKGGKYRHNGNMGRVLVRVPNHKRSGSNGYVPRSIIIAEGILGKSLPKGTIVHHYGKIDDDTKIVVCENIAYHNLLHQRQRAYAACGNAGWLKCYICKEYDNPKNLYINARRHSGYHVHCRREKRRALKNESSTKD